MLILLYVTYASNPRDFSQNCMHFVWQCDAKKAQKQIMNKKTSKNAADCWNFLCILKHHIICSAAFMHVTPETVFF